MEKHYKVFVSSTFKDLEGARQEVFSALLKSDCFPSGMELFPAADMEQFDYIKQIIVECDYYIIVSAGMYGSVHPDLGKSYTELEYDYAVKIGKPIIRLVHKDPFRELKGNLIESDPEKLSLLKEFRKKLLGSRLANLWEDPKDLGQQVILSLLDAKKRYPSPGWVRGDKAISVEILQELEELRTKKRRPEAKENTTKVVDFSDLTGTTEVSLLSSDEEESIYSEGPKGKKFGKDMIANSVIAEAIFCALISSNHATYIKSQADRDLSKNYTFPKSSPNHKKLWLEVPYHEVRHFLHYLESRGLVKESKSFDKDWELTAKGRLHATFISSRKHLM